MSPTSASGGEYLNLRTGGEHISAGHASPASLKRQAEVLPMAKLEQLRYDGTSPSKRQLEDFACGEI